MADPEQMTNFLTRAGPYAVTFIVLCWLFLERRERIAAQDDAKGLRTQMLDMQGKAITAMHDFGDEIKEGLREHDSVIKNLDATIRASSRVGFPEAKGGE
jgi:hypothetical protein